MGRLEKNFGFLGKKSEKLWGEQKSLMEGRKTGVKDYKDSFGTEWTRVSGVGRKEWGRRKRKRGGLRDEFVFIDGVNKRLRKELRIVAFV